MELDTNMLITDFYVIKKQIIDDINHIKKCYPTGLKKLMIIKKLRELLIEVDKIIFFMKML